MDANTKPDTVKITIYWSSCQLGFGNRIKEPVGDLRLSQMKLAGFRGS